MITKLYLDNYKGFNKALIPIEEVNFLVGDNSTGKTTIMNLLYILDHCSIPLRIDLNDEVKLGGFNDIVNKYSEDTTYFAFGCEKVVGGKVMYHHWKFGNNKDTASLEEYCAYKHNTTTRFRLKNKIEICELSEGEEIDYISWLNNMPKGKFKKVEKNGDEFKSLLISLLFSNDGDSIKILLERGMLKFSPVRAQAKAYYDNYDREFKPEGSHVATCLKSLSEKNNKKSKDLIEILNDFGRESSLFEEIEVEKLTDTDSSLFSVDLRYGKVRVNISNVGYGVSQVLPLVVDMLRCKKKQIAIPQPEVHLHPKAQCAFGTLVFKNWLGNGNRFLLETHSEYMINRFRYELSLSEKKPKGRAQVLFFERTEKGNVVTPMPIGYDGKFDCEIPDNYGDFFVDEELKMLDL